ncbi:hypothetical protein [Tropicimonas aquimaris]|uniref:DUF1127 domain-containing protein n=1 Tax=Tropicimonas aquimaris TaxID=914152 RepID=A0ABW3IZE0_9RHOB
MLWRPLGWSGSRRRPTPPILAPELSSHRLRDLGLEPQIDLGRIPWPAIW